MTVQDLEYYFRKKDFDTFDKLAAQLLHSFDGTERQRTQQLMALSVVARRRYSGNSAYDEQIAQYKQQFLSTPPQQLKEKLVLAEILIFQKDFAAAEHILHTILAKAKIREDQELAFCATALLGNCHIEQNHFREALILVKDLAVHYPFEEVSAETSSEIFKTLVQALLKSQDFTALEEFSKTLLTLSIQTNDAEKEIIARNNLAIVNSIRHDYKEAMSYFLDALDIAIGLNYRQSIANTLINIGTIYANLQNHEEALARYQTILEHYHDILEINTLAIIHNNVGNIFYLIGDITRAKDYFEKSLEFARVSQYQEILALAYVQLSKVYQKENQLNEAFALAHKANTLMTENGIDNEAQLLQIHFASLYLDQNNYDIAITLAKKGLEKAKTLADDANAMKAMRLLSEVYEKKANFESAFFYEKAYNQLQDKVVKEQSRLQAIDIEIRYDIREKQQQIEQLRRENAYQGQLIIQGEQIAAQNTQLVHANEELQQFAYIVSHDLKEPLRMIASYAQLIMFRYKDVVDENFQTYLDYMTEGVTRMSALLDGLLQYGTVGKEKEDKEEVDLNDIVEAAQFNLKLLIKETNANIIVAPLPTIVAHPSRMIQLFQNLINNALKFRATDRQPEIHISCTKKGAIYHFCVKDNGIGIEDEHTERIFAIFQRLHPRHQYEGTGIGLSICQKIVQHLGGNIWVTSTYGEGSEFQFELPVSAVR